MAKIKLGAIVTDIRNKLGGHVFSKNRSGSYMRTLVTPVNPQTADQTAVRSLFGSISQGWSSLTEVQRNSFRESVQAWATTDIFGDLKNPTGKALYQRLNQQAQVVGYSAITTCPQPSEIASSIITAALIELTDSELDLGDRSVSADSTIQLFATAPLSEGTKFVKDKLRQIYFATGDTYDTAAAYTGYVDKFGTPSAGANIYIGVKYVDANGNSTPLQTLKATVNA